MSKPLCIIPARAGSKRLSGKNILEFQGKPLLAHAIEVAKESGVFDAVCVSSEDDTTLNIATEYGADIALKRPAELATDTAQIRQVCTYLLQYFVDEGKEYDTFGLLIPTNPLRSADDIRDAYRLLTTQDANTVMSVSHYSHPPLAALEVEEGFLKPKFDESIRKRSQEIVQLYHHDGAVIFCRTASFLAEGEFYGTKVIPYFTPHERAVDIDTEADLDYAEFLASRTTHFSSSS